MIENTRNNEIPSLTGLRFFAAFFVFLSHGLPQIMPMDIIKPAWYTILSSLYVEGMSLFFVLSGFVIHYNYSSRLYFNQRRSMFNFFVSRFARLYPLFLLGLAIDLLLNMGYLRDSFKDAIPFYLTLIQSWVYIPMDNSALIYQFGPLPSIGWSISSEWFFYVIYPLLCFGLLKMKQLRSKALAFILITVVVFSVITWLISQEVAINEWAAFKFGAIGAEANGFQDSFYRWLIYFSPYSRVSEFLLGCIVASIYMQLKDKSPSPQESLVGFGLLVLSITMICVLHYFAFAQNNWVKSLEFRRYAEKFVLCFGVAPFISIIIFFCARYQNIFSRFFTTRIFIIGGQASYSLYLFHVVIIQAFSRDTATISSTTALSVYVADISRLCVTFVATLGMAILFYKNVEMPARQALYKKLSMRKPEESFLEQVA